jgi:hypothetical protein
MMLVLGLPSPDCMRRSSRHWRTSSAMSREITLSPREYAYCASASWMSFAFW